MVTGVFIWQAVTAHGNPDPMARGLSPAAMILSTAVLVFREGLEAILVLAAVTAGMARTGRKDYLRAVPVGGGLAFLASIATWFVVVAVISHITAPALDVQAATGLLAIVVLLVIMNWFFHKVYWTGWIGGHASRRKRIMEAEDAGGNGAATFWGLALLGFTAIYREGFEIVLFLQNLRLRAGSALALTTPVLFWAGGRFFRGAWLSLKQRSSDMNTLIAIGTGTAYLFSSAVTVTPSMFGKQSHVYYETADVIITLLLLGRLLEARAKGKTGSAIE